MARQLDMEYIQGGNSGTGIGTGSDDQLKWRRVKISCAVEFSVIFHEVILVPQVRQ
jgi:hypothetical protein